MDINQTNSVVQAKPYVLIIDEINRANLPAVLGELIYALEYRGESVESMYAINGNASLMLPPNLYIIGTMNTADRSVGHIDYAIRRRFAFVEVLPDESVITDKIAQKLFGEVKNLFIKDGSGKTTLAPDFNWQDVMLGHSYFLGTLADLELKLEYEIKPLLREYIKDGILLESASVIVENLKIVKVPSAPPAGTPSPAGTVAPPARTPLPAGTPPPAGTPSPAGTPPPAGTAPASPATAAATTAATTTAAATTDNTPPYNHVN